MGFKNPIRAILGHTTEPDEAAGTTDERVDREMTAWRVNGRQGPPPFPEALSDGDKAELARRRDFELTAGDARRKRQGGPSNLFASQQRAGNVGGNSQPFTNSILGSKSRNQLNILG